MLFLVRYGEIALKSPGVQKRFRGFLKRNLLDMAERDGVAMAVDMEPGRVFVRGDDPAAIRIILTRTMGVVSFSPVSEASSDLDQLKAAVVAFSEPWFDPSLSFGIRARRSGSHPYTSQDLGRELGAAMFARWPDLVVDLKTAAQPIHVEVRDKRAYLHREIVPGPGGMPLGSQGRVIAIIDSPRAALAAWLMMKRGARVDILGEVDDHSRVLQTWAPHLRFVQEPFHADRYEAIILDAPLVEITAPKIRGLAALYPAAGLREEDLVRIRAVIDGT